MLGQLRHSGEVWTATCVRVTTDANIVRLTSKRRLNGAARALWTAAFLDVCNCIQTFVVQLGAIARIYPANV